MKGTDISSLVLNLFLWGLKEIFVAACVVLRVEKEDFRCDLR